jgi:MarR family transcriptional regulator for hemolysin
MDQPLSPLVQLSAGLLPAARLWQRVADAALSSHGLSAACTAPLLLIGRSGGGIRQVTLAQQLGVESPSLVRLLDRLGTLGLIRRECDSSDRRANQLWLTEDGQALVQQLEQRLAALRQDVLGTLSEDEIAAVLKLWRLLAEANARLHC